MNAQATRHDDDDNTCNDLLWRRVYLHVFKLLRDADDAADVVQETFLAAATAKSPYQGRSAYASWLMGIASHKANDLLRLKYRHQRVYDKLTDTLAGQAPANPDQAELIQQALAGLKPRNREALHLRYCEGWCYARLADHFGLTRGGIDSLLWRARQELRTAYLALQSRQADQ